MTIPDKAIEAAGAELQTHIELSESLAKAMARDAITIALPYLLEETTLDRNAHYQRAERACKERDTAYRAGIEAAAQRVENLYTSNGPQCAVAIRALADEKVKP